MTTTVLAYIPSPAQGVWYIGSFPIRAYALCIIAGIIAALMIGDRRWAARGGERGVIYDVALWAVPFGLVGGRLYHVLTDWQTYFGPNGAGIGAAAKIWEGGLGIWGAIALGAVGAWIGCRRKGIPLPAFGDAVAPGVVLAQAIGRLGNYFNQELYGRETTVPWALEIFYRRDASGAVGVHSLDGVSTGEVAFRVHPTFLYELLWNLLVFVFLLWADRRFKLGHGRLFALYVAAYCVGRFWVELMRDDTATHIAGIRINVFTATFVFIGAVVYLLLAPKGREDPEELRGWEPEDTDDEESVADEWAGDLVAAVKGSGILAAATVAGDHETEDSAAVGDAEDLTGDTLVIEAVRVGDEAADEGEGAEGVGVEAVEVEAGETADAGVDTEAEEEAADEAADDTTVIAVAADEAGDDTTVIVYSGEVAGDEAAVEVAGESVVEQDAETVAVDEHAEPAETVVVDQEPESAETVVEEHEPEPGETVVVDEHSATELSDADADALLADHVSAEMGAEVSADAGAEAPAETAIVEDLEAEASGDSAQEATEDVADEVIESAGESVDEPQPDAEPEPAEPEPADLAESEADAEAESEAEAEAETEPEPKADAQPEAEADAEAEPDAEPEAVAEPEPEPEPDAKAETESETEPVKPETVPNSDSEAPHEPEPAVETPPPAEPKAPAVKAANPEPPDEPKLGSTLRRLLWGAGNRGGK